MKYVVDTNVPIVANGLNTNASVQCRINAIDFLEKMMFKGHLFLDAAGDIEAEYGNNLNFGAPGVGNRFIQAFLTSAADRVHRIDIEKVKGAFVDFPVDKNLKNFDLSDRKFAALARKAKVPVANATDSDWLDSIGPLNANGIAVEFLCGCVKKDWIAI